MIYINRKCKYYDWGDSAPREYGAFCSLKKVAINKANCIQCPESSKPPLGVMPKKIWDLKRLQDLEDAINRYKEANKSIPYEWIKEFQQLYEEYPTFKD